MDYVSVFAMCVRALPTHAALSGLNALCDRSKYMTSDSKEKTNDDDESDDNDFFAQVRVYSQLFVLNATGATHSSAPTRSCIASTR